MGFPGHHHLVAEGLQLLLEQHRGFQGEHVFRLLRLDAAGAGADLGLHLLGIRGYRLQGVIAILLMPRVHTDRLLIPGFGISRCRKQGSNQQCRKDQMGISRKTPDGSHLLTPFCSPAILPGLY
ncbi:hypothetical protein D3C75_1095750 [compost metagenome]